MAFGAVGFCFCPLPLITTANVLGVRYGFEVGGFRAMPNPAEVVQDEPRRHRAACQLPANDVDSTGRPKLPHSSVPLVKRTTDP